MSEHKKQKLYVQRHYNPSIFCYTVSVFKDPDHEDLLFYVTYFINTTLIDKVARCYPETEQLKRIRGNFYIDYVNYKNLIQE